VFGRRGAFVALNDPKDDLLDMYLPRTRELLGPFFIRGAQIDGKLYGIPVNKEQAGSSGLLLRKDIVDKYKLDVSGIKTLEDLEPFLKAVKKAEPLMAHPLWPPGDGSVSNYVTLAGPAVMRGIGGDTKVYDFLELPDVRSYFNTIRRFYEEDLIRKDAATMSDYVPDVTAGKVFAIGTVAIPGADKGMENQTGMPWYQVNLSQPVVTNDVPMGGMNAISVTSRDPARAAMFMEIINTDTYLNNLINFGIEGVHYVKVSDNVITFAPGTNDGRSSGYNPGIAWAFANQRLNYFFENEDPGKWAKIDAYDKTAVAVNSLGFYVDEDPIKNELAALATASDEFIPALEVGAADPATYVPLAIAKYKACGIDRVIAEVQKQYDAWRAAVRR
jgi:putative aldouronate transport system substrate-binding protein